jgi:hypothetical protein
MLVPPRKLPAFLDRPSHGDARLAWQTLQEIIIDFPFEREVHRAAWLAALLTPLARFAFFGPAPLFLVDANVRAAGKGLLLDCISRIVTGERFTVATYTRDDDELRKRITALALAGDRLVLFDNLSGQFGGPVLDAVLTATSWTDRILGANRIAKAPLYITWYATGNNVMMGADTPRRTCNIRLESEQERPEERTGFRYPNLLAWVANNRERLLGAALTILRAYHVAGKPDQQLPPWGSFEGWSEVVRSAVVWLGLPDPGETRLVLLDRADVIADSMRVFLVGLERLDPDRCGLTASEIIQRVKENPESHRDLHDAAEALIGKLESRALGNRLKSYRRRMFEGRFIDHAGSKQRAVRWAVYPASAFRHRSEDTHQTHHTHSPDSWGSESGESSESASPQPENRSREREPGEEG